MGTSLQTVTSNTAYKPLVTGNVQPGSGKPLPSALPDVATPAEVKAESGKQLEALNKEERRSSIPSLEVTKKAAEEVNEKLRDQQRDLEFQVDESSGRTVVKVIHTESGEVIRQMPPEVVLQFARAFTDGSASLLEDFA